MLPHKQHCIIEHYKNIFWKWIWAFHSSSSVFSLNYSKCLAKSCTPVIHVKFGCRVLLSPGRNPQQNWDAGRGRRTQWVEEESAEAVKLTWTSLLKITFLLVMVDTERDGRKVIQTWPRNRRFHSPTLFVPPCKKYIITHRGREKITDFSLFIQKEFRYLTPRTCVEEFLQISIILNKSTLLLITQDNVQSSTSATTLKETYTDLYIW